MAGQIKVNQVQLGDSLTETQNFVWQTNVDGTAKLARGNVGETTQDILTVDANGRVAFNQNAVYFRATQAAGQTVTNGVAVVPNFTTEIEDAGGYYDTTTRRYTPLVAGLYAVSVGNTGSGATTTGRLTSYIYKNTTTIVLNTCAPLGTPNTAFSNVSTHIYMNGTTDYIEAQALLEGTGTLTLNGSIANSFSAYLIART
jgi:hypothetical protein